MEVGEEGEEANTDETITYKSCSVPRGQARSSGTTANLSNPCKV